MARTLYSHGIVLTALYNHEILISPNYYFLHSWGTGDPITLAQAFRDALNHINSKFMEIIVQHRLRYQYLRQIAS